MPRLAIRSAIWIILTLLFRLAVTENKTYPEQNFLDSREDRSAHGSFRNFWKQRPSRENKSLGTVGSESPNEILRFRAAGDINFGGYKNASLNRRTLMDYNGPVITEDLDDTGDQNLAGHIRVKRNEPIVRHRPSSVNFQVNLLPRNSWRRTDVTSIFGDSAFEGSRSDHENRSGTTVDTMVSHSRHKRGLVSENGHRRKRVKGNTGYSKHNVETRNRNKKHGVSKSPHQLVTKKKSNPTSRKKNKNTQEIGMPIKKIDKSRVESRIEKRESENSDFDINTGTVNEKAEVLISQKEDASLTNNRSFAEQRQENAIMLPFVHTGRAELRVRIEKIPTNASSLVSPSYSTDRSVGISPCSIVLPKYNTSDENLDVNTNLKLAPNFDSVGRGKADNVTVEITLKKLDLGDVSGQETSKSEDTSFYNAEVRPTGSDVLGIEDNRNAKNEKYDRTNEASVELSDEDAKSRAKRNQQVTSKRYLRSDKNAKDSTRFKDTEQGIRDTKREKTRTLGNRVVRSIEEIKNLAEKLIAKINELQVYVSNRNETLCTRDFCLGKDVARKEEPRISLEKKKDVLSSASKIADSRRRFAKEAAATSAGKKASPMRSSGSRFARGEYRTRRRPRRKWGRWMDWSSCSVTCGKGRQIRWRHCLHDCNDAETEMEEKACQLPACPPSKFLGIF
ncbi:PREDICTED: uncharacterized protein LOC105456004 [Wasmannia auropunctata]|uniref:uncharacterized protein LOC105456004 n=1 Tax=Wasmannia auropunctata TaxID=64793 RepID=UPI0005EE66B2|nr:PREDICTED: uncharacterized protein LOC105456004 [Wasmannia auropunctata]